MIIKQVYMKDVSYNNYFSLVGPERSVLFRIGTIRTPIAVNLFSTFKLELKR